MKQIMKFDRAIVVLGAVCFAASYFSTAYGKTASYTMFICTFLIVCLSVVQNHGIIRFRLDAYHAFTLIFISYCYLSSLWARDASLTLTLSRRIFLTLLFLYMQYMHYQKRTTDYLLMIAMLGGYIASFVTVWQQGFNLYLSSIKSGIRVYDQEFINANIAGVMATHAILLNVYFVIYKRKIGWWSLLSIPALVCVAGAGSKRSLLLLLGGCAMLVFLHSYDRKKLLTSVIRIFLMMLLLVGIAYVLSSIPMFAMITARVEEFIGSITGTSKMDGSTKERLQFMNVGIYLLKKSPLFGCGIDNPRLFNWVRHTYLHSNMMELLAGGGIIGFGLYYSIHLYLFYSMWKYRKYRDDAYDIVFVILLFLLIFDISDMTYDAKDTYFYFMAMFIEVQHLKRKAHNRFDNRVYQELSSVPERLNYI